jgi:hypothetical protein
MILSCRDLIQSNQPIILQPIQIDNAFFITPGERIRQIYECDVSVCGCGPIYTVTLTDARIIQRLQDHMCCCEGDRIDSMLFLSDISSIKNTFKIRCGTPCVYSGAACFLLLCFPIGLLCSLCRLFCSKDIPKTITLNGAFGKEEFIFSHRDVYAALGDIPAAAMPHKISSHMSSNQML